MFGKECFFSCSLCLLSGKLLQDARAPSFFGCASLLASDSCYVLQNWYYIGLLWFIEQMNKHIIAPNNRVVPICGEKNSFYFSNTISVEKLMLVMMSSLCVRHVCMLTGFFLEKHCIFAVTAHTFWFSVQKISLCYFFRIWLSHSRSVSVFEI